MDFLKKAIDLDVKEDYEHAIELYERIIQSDLHEIDAYINLSFLYWEIACEFPFRNEYNISNETFDISYKRYNEVLNIAINIFPNNAELHFWKAYFPHIILGEELPKDEVLHIISTYEKTNLVPYFFLYLFHKERYKEERQLLLKECEILPTAKNLYIKSIIGPR